MPRRSLYSTKFARNVMANGNFLQWLLRIALYSSCVQLTLLGAAQTASVSAKAQSRGIYPAVNVEELDHVALNVTNLDRSYEWYQKVFGFAIFHKWNTTWMIHRGTMKIGLFLRPKAQSIGDTDNKLAITHFAFVTTPDEFKDAQSHLKKLGIKFDPPEDTGIAYSIFLSDPDGYQVEITTYHMQ